MKCTCIVAHGNTGVPNCQAVFDVTKKAILLPYFKNDGTINGMDLTGLAVIDQVYLDAKTQALSASDRWYPTPEMKNIEDVRAEDILESFEDGTSVFIQEGARTFLGLFVGQSPQFKGQLDKWRCETVGVYLIDKSGNLIGDNSRDGFLDPIKVQKDSISVGLQKGTDTTLQKVTFGFTVDQLMDDAKLSMISASNITASLSSVGGLIDASAINTTSITTTGFVLDMVTPYGGVISRTKALGLELADFKLYNATQSAAIVATTVTEDEGNYTFVIPAQNSADVINVTNKDSGTLDKGYDITAFNVTIP